MTTTESSMAKDAEIVVARVANGYMVSQRPDRSGYFSMDEALVFPSLAALVEFLGKHFTYRAHAVPMDPAPLESMGLGAIGQTHTEAQQAINAHARAQLDALPFATGKITGDTGATVSLSGAAIIEG